MRDEQPKTTAAEAKRAADELRAGAKPAGGQPPVNVTGGEPAKEEAEPAGRKTTRGMLPALKAADNVYRTLSELKPEEARWVLDFINLKFPKGADQ